MMPAGITGRIVDQVAALLEEGDIIIDGGNSNYRDDVRRATKPRSPGRTAHVVCGRPATSVRMPASSR
jgi:6-phosphogluconate dehydrogenase (decarboxylating)